MVGMLSQSERCELESAISDRDLCNRMIKSEWLRDAVYRMPSWLDQGCAIIGRPTAVSPARKMEFEKPNLEPAGQDEMRLVRNKKAIKQVVNEIAQSEVTHLKSTILAPFYQRFQEDHNTIVQLRREVSGLEADLEAALQQRQPGNKEKLQTPIPATEDVPAIISTGEKELSNVELPALVTNGVGERATHADLTRNEAPTADVTESDPPFVSSTDESALVPRVETPASMADVEPTPDSRTLTSPTPKRKAPATPSHDAPEVRHIEAGRIFDDDLARLAIHVFEQVRKPLPRDPIDACGPATLSIMIQRPRDAVNLAHQKLYATTPDKVEKCWHRLYEDATLCLIAQLLHKQSLRAQPAANRAKRRKLTDGAISGSWLEVIVGKLDKVIIVAGAPGRRDLIDDIFEVLDPIAQRTIQDEGPQRLVRGLTPRGLVTKSPITRPKVVMSPHAFRHYVDRVGNVVRPLVLRGVMADWPAMELWQDLLYLKRHTMAGHRLVPIEVGKSYTDPGWRQEIITFSEFAERFLVPDKPEQTGYLAQYDIFRQIPTLRSDIHIPDYCYSAPPRPTGAAARTKGLDTVQDMDQPLLNAWLGPKGTKSPLHTDPYHNILCQVVGYKYVRLYAPEQTDRLYPMGVDEVGIEMDNTSQVDISIIRPTGNISPGLEAMRADTRKRFPLLEGAAYEEAMLGPGESLYIPLGWWHYVESLTTSISVSFWWN